MSDEVLVKVENVNKKFCRRLRRSLWYGMQDMVRETVGRNHSHERLRKDEFWAVKNASFELHRGECLGLIGRNGAGKTTLLKMLNGLIKPDAGRITMRGRIGALIALGAGFNPVLTGRENIYVNGAVLGLSKREINAKLEEIIDFSEIRDFIDAPVQTYSSGMTVRLGFSVAANLLDPDVLFLDEVLAVGDIGFTIKCLNTVRRLTQKSAVVFVSHNMQFISSFCTRVIVMEKGSPIIDTVNPSEGIDRYFSMVQHESQVSGTGDAEILDLDILENGKPTRGDEPHFAQGIDVAIILKLRIRELIDGAHINLAIHDESMAPLMAVPLHKNNSTLLRLPPGGFDLKIPLGPLELNSGKYSFVISIRDADTGVVLARTQGMKPFRVIASRTHWGRIVRPAITSILREKAN